MRFLCIAFLEGGESKGKLGRMKNGHVLTFPFLHATNAAKPKLSCLITTKAS